MLAVAPSMMCCGFPVVYPQDNLQGFFGFSSLLLLNPDCVFRFDPRWSIVVDVRFVCVNKMLNVSLVAL